MKNREILNGIAAVRRAMESYNALKGDVTAPGLEMELLWLLDGLCAENSSLLNAGATGELYHRGGLSLGRCTVELSMIPAALELLRERLPELMKGDRLSVPLSLDPSKGIALFLETDTAGQDGASVMAQYVLLSQLKKDGNLNFRCADLVRGGSFFSAVHDIIAQFPRRTGGRVFTKAEDIDGVLKDLESAAADALSILGGNYDTVEEYDAQSSVKLQKWAAVIYLSDTDDYRTVGLMNRLRLLMENRAKNGLSFIMVGSRAQLETLEILADHYIRYSSAGCSAGCRADLPFTPDEGIKLSGNMAAELSAGMQSADIVDTRFESYPELDCGLFKMESSKALRIPFAVDKNGIVQYFEIGGEAPPHALLSGSTGSGKSVALHTLIMQTIRNYHPDDVEIWAIDYKAVEFDSYIRHRTPHFRVIGYDTSQEFSLSLLDEIYAEYEERQRKFLKAGVKSIGQYRRKMGAHSMPRLVIFIDEFQIMTQAVQEYTGEINYRQQLENLLRLTRAMGISFVFCSQTIASGLQGLSESARDQIGCRMCLKHDDDVEIRETLVLSGEGASEIAARAREQRKGQAIYKRARWAGEHSPDGKAYEFKDCNILYINDELKEQMIDAINLTAAGTFTPKEEIIVRGSGRIAVSEKLRHPISRFVTKGYEPDEELLEWYPAAPTTLADDYCVRLDASAGANVLMVGEEDSLRESITLHSLCGFLMDPDTRIVASFVDEENSKRARLIRVLKRLCSPRLKVRPSRHKMVYLWYGLDKLKNEIFLLEQDEEDEQGQASDVPALALNDLMMDLASFLSEVNGAEVSTKKKSAPGDALSFEDCRGILLQAFEMGPENGQHHFAIFNNYRGMKKCGIVELESFEHRIGCRMSGDDSYELFGSSTYASRMDENTVLHYTGSGKPVPLRPYLMPDAEWFEKFNESLKEL